MNVGQIVLMEHTLQMEVAWFVAIDVRLVLEFQHNVLLAMIINSYSRTIASMNALQPLSMESALIDAQMEAILMEMYANHAVMNVRLVRVQLQIV